MALSVKERLAKNSSNTVYITHEEYKTLDNDTKKMLNGEDVRIIKYTRGNVYDFNKDVIGCWVEYGAENYLRNYPNAKIKTVF